MDKPTVIRRVRIAMSVFFGLLTVALCVLWVRSYWIEYGLTARFVDMPSSDQGYFGYQMVSVSCGGGKIAFGLYSGIGGWSGPAVKAGIYPTQYHYDREEDESLLTLNYDVDEIEQVPRVLGIPGFYFQFDGWNGDIWLSVPIWLVSALTAALIASPWILKKFRRFSLRTMLIATTLVAVVLGLVCYAVR